ncbi:type VI secretion protein [Collimonas pratensis]|uniref:Type VI secretion protein n=1 Tax=Collimonas pratensis TaxID=279113 RepID=A0A127Q7Z4_9BURK|nr:type VI secretion protein [Collimonas pratensis]
MFIGHIFLYSKNFQLKFRRLTEIQKVISGLMPGQSLL